MRLTLVSAGVDPLFEYDAVDVIEIRDGRVARLAWYGTRAEAAEAA